MKNHRVGIALALTLLLAGLVASSATAEGRSYKGLRWAEDWSWLADSDDNGSDPFDSVKWVPLGENGHFTFGGSFRLRGEWDENRTLGASPEEHDSLLRGRVFLHGELGYKKVFRWFWEVRASHTWGSERPVPGTFRDDPDFQNFFFEVTGGSETTHPVTVRVGRQELLFGAQRLVSPLDWVSTRRTFDGLTVTAATPRTKTVVFATHPVMHEIHDIDSPDEHVLFAGVYTTFKPKPGHLWDFYAMLKDDDRDSFGSEVHAEKGDLTRRTWGFRYRWQGERWAAETEWAYQEGEVAHDDICAFFGTVVVERTWKGAAWKPKLTFGLDIASGDDDSGDGDQETFDQLYPLGHAYFGHLDLQARKNVRAARIQVAVKPHPRVTWVTALHRMELAAAEDAFYNGIGKPIRSDPTGAAGRSVGTELDSLVKIKIGDHQSVAFEVAHFWGDSFVERTRPDPAAGDDATFFWAAWSYLF